MSLPTNLEALPDSVNEPEALPVAEAAQEAQAAPNEAPSGLSALSLEQLLHSHQELTRKFNEQEEEMRSYRDTAEKLLAQRQPAPEPAEDPAAVEQKARAQRCQARADQLYARYIDQGFEEKQARRYAWDDAAAEDTLARDNVRQLVEQLMEPLAQMVEQEVAPAAIEREVAQAIGAEVPAGEVLQSISEAFATPVGQLRLLPEATRKALYALAKDAVKGRRQASAPAHAPAQTPPATLTPGAARPAARSLSSEQQSRLDRLRRAFPTLAEKELVDIL